MTSISSAHTKSTPIFHWPIGATCPRSRGKYIEFPLCILPATDFYTTHATEIQEALKSKVSWEFPRLHAKEKLALDAGLTDDEKKAHGLSLIHI